MCQYVRFSFGTLILSFITSPSWLASSHLTLGKTGTDGAYTTHRIHAPTARVTSTGSRGPGLLAFPLSWDHREYRLLGSTPNPRLPESVCRNTWPLVSVYIYIYMCVHVASVCMYVWQNPGHGLQFCVCVCVCVTYSCDVHHLYPLLWMRRINHPRCSLLAVWYWSQMHVNRA